MEIKTGYIYHIKDTFFDKINDKGLMINHENGKARPTYFTIKNGDILWFIPLSTKVDKYRTIIAKKEKREFIIDEMLHVLDEYDEYELQNICCRLHKQ